MNKELRKAVIAGNWKMNKTPAEAKVLMRKSFRWWKRFFLRRGSLCSICGSLHCC